MLLVNQFESSAFHLPPDGWCPTYELPLTSIQQALSAFRTVGPEEFRDVRNLYWRRLTSIANSWVVCAAMPGPVFGLGLYWLWTPQGHWLLDANVIDALVASGVVSLEEPSQAEEWVSLVALCRQDAEGKPAWLVPPQMQLTQLLANAESSLVAELDKPTKATRKDDGSFEVQATAMTSDGSLLRMRIVVSTKGKVTSVDLGRKRLPAAPERAYAALTPHAAHVHTQRMMDQAFGAAAEEQPRWLAWVDQNAKLAFRLLMVISFVGAVGLALCLTLWQAARASLRLLLMPGFALSRSRGVLYDIWAFYVRKIFAYLERHPVVRIGCVTAWFATLGALVYVLPWPVAMVPALLLGAGYLHATFFVYLPNESVRTNIFRRLARDVEAIRTVHDFTWEYLAYVLLFLLCVPLIVFKLNVATSMFTPDIAADVGASYRYLGATLFNLVPDAAQSLMPQIALAPPAVEGRTQLLQSLVIWLVQATVGTMVFAKIAAARNLRTEAVARLRHSFADAVSLGMRIAPEMRRIVSESDVPEGPFSRLLWLGRWLIGRTRLPELRGQAALVLGLIDDRASANTLRQLWESDAPDEVRNLALMGHSLLNPQQRLNPQDSYVLSPSAYGGDHALDIWRAIAAMRSPQPASEALPELRTFLQWRHLAPLIRQQIATTILRAPDAYSVSDVFEWVSEFSGAEQLAEERLHFLHEVARAMSALDLHEVTSRIGHLIGVGPPQVWLSTVKLMGVWLTQRHLEAGYDGTAVAMQEELLKAFGAAMESDKGGGPLQAVNRRLRRWRLTARFGFAFLMLAGFYSERKGMRPNIATPASASA